LISLYYLLKKMRFNRTACQHTVRTRVSSCHKMPNFITRNMWYPIGLKWKM